MRKLYWRPQHISARVVTLLAVVAIVGLVIVESSKVQEKQSNYNEKLAAAKLAAQSFALIREERLARKIPIDPTTDPTRSGLIGVLLTPTTTNTGQLSAKQTSINPNFAAVFVHLLKRIELQAGDVVAVGSSGSFPAMNITMLAACKALGLRPLIISSVGSSQWGANHPDLMYPDMERVLRRRGLLPFKSLAVSLGGVDDEAVGLSEAGRQQLRTVIKRNNLVQLQAASFEDNLKMRMAIYRQHAGDAEIKAYINIGGGTTSVGTRVSKRLFKPGLNRKVPRGAAEIDSVMTRFAKKGIPVIHVTKVEDLAQRYGLPIEPTQTPPVGEGKIFIREEYSKWIAAGVLAFVLGLMFIFIRLDLAYRLFPAAGQKGPASPEQMV